LAKEIEKMELELFEGLKLPHYEFFCDKNFVSGLVKVKKNNFDSVLRTSHNYPTRYL